MGERGSVRVLIVEDEPLGRRRLLDLLEREGDVEVVGTAADGVAAVEAIRTSHPDLVFLDVQMPRMSGLEVLREIGPAAMPLTVFVTAYDQYALKAFESAAVDYLLKPFRDERFEEAMRRARRLLQLQGRERLHEQLLALLSGEPASRPPEPAPRHLERIAVQMRGKMRVVPVEQIDYITASGTYVVLHVGPDRFVVRDTLQSLEGKLDPERFQRIHRSTIVRLDVVDTLLRSEGSDYEVQLRGGARLRVGRSHRELLEQRLGRVR